MGNHDDITAKFEKAGEALVRQNLAEQRYGEATIPIALNWLDERDRAAKFASNVEQAQLALTSSIAARDAADAARDQAAAAAEANRLSRHANVVATLALVFSVIAIAVSVIGAFLSRR